MEVNQTLPSLVNGVSQQAPELRHDTTVDEMINCSLSFTEGTRRRNPLVETAIDNTIADYPFIHTYERGDGTEAYIIAITDGEWKTYDLEGSLQDSGTDSYLSIPSGTRASESFSAVTVGDTTFIVNKTKTVAESTTYTHGTSNKFVNKEHSYYWVKRTYISYGGENNATKNTYSYTINGTTNSNKDTEDGAKSDLVASNLANLVGGTSSGSIIYRAANVPAYCSNSSYSNQADCEEPNTWYYDYCSNGTTYNDDGEPSSDAQAAADETQCGPLGMGYVYTPAVCSDPSHTTKAACEAPRATWVEPGDAWVTSDSWGNQASEGWQGVLKKLQDLPNTMGSYSGLQTLVNVTGDEQNKFEGFWAWVKNPGEAWVETVAPGIKDGFQNSTMPHILERTAIGNFTFKEFDYYDRDKGDELSNSMPSFVGQQIEDVFFYRNRLGFISGDNIIMSETGIYENFFRTTVTDLLDTDVIDVAVDTNSVANLKYAIPFNENLIVFGTHAQYIMGGDKALTPSTASLAQTTTYDINANIAPKAIGPNLYFSINRGAFTQVREYFNIPGSTGNDATDITSHIPTYIDHHISELETSTKYDMVFLLAEDTNEIYVYNQTWEGEEKSQSAWHRWELTNASIFNIKVVSDDLFIMYDSDGDRKLGKISLESKDFTNVTYTDATGPYESSITLNEWGFQTGGGNKVDNKEGRLQIRKLTIQDRPSSDQDIEVTVGPHTKVFHRHIQGGPTATIMGESQKTAITIKSVDSSGFCIDSLNLTGRFNSKSRAI